MVSHDVCSTIIRGVDGLLSCCWDILDTVIELNLAIEL